MNNIEIVAHNITEIEQIFMVRSHLHRALVKKNLLLMDGYLGLSLESLSEAAEFHDLSKFREPERNAYKWMTWIYHCKKNGITFTNSKYIQEIITAGWQHHIKNNKHHPEAHQTPEVMSDLDIVEMVCDWTAIAQENNEDNGSCLAWAKMNINKKWHFSSSKKNLIFATISELDYRRGKI